MRSLIMFSFVVLKDYDANFALIGSNKLPTMQDLVIVHLE
jgi:hypothetical protein